MDAKEFRERLRRVLRERAVEAGPAPDRGPAALPDVWPVARRGGITVAGPAWPAEVPGPPTFDVALDAVVLDVEAMGFRDFPAFLVGCVRVRGGRFEVLQYVAEHPDEESALLEAVSRVLNGTALWVTYGGKTYDLPFLRARSTVLRVDWPAEVSHLDLRYAVRRRFGAELQDCRLATVGEQLFGVRRRRDVGSASVPDLYRRYIKTGNGRVLVPALEHNLLDVAVSALLFAELARRFPEDVKIKPTGRNEDQGGLFGKAPDAKARY